MLKKKIKLWRRQRRKTGCRKETDGGMIKSHMQMRKR